MHICASQVQILNARVPAVRSMSMGVPKLHSVAMRCVCALHASLTSCACLCVCLWMRVCRPLASRSVGTPMLHKVAKVVYEPLGVIGAIVPWNYPFHNVLNPVLAAVFAGNGAVVKVRASKAP